MKDFLLLTFGSSGDVNPFVGIGVALKSRGHSVTLATNPYFEDLIGRAGLEFIPVGTAEEFRATLDHPDLWHPRRGLRFVIREGMIPTLRPSFDISHSFAQSHANAIVIASSMALGARIAQEKFGIPLATVHLQPQIFQSLEDTPVFPQADVSRWPRWAKRLVFRMGDWMVDRMLTPEFNALRREVGLAPVYRIFNGWVHSPQLTLGLWPEWFASPQRDWPPQVKLTGFPLYDAGGVEEMPQGLEEFLAAGPAPVIFTPGSAMRQGKSFFQESMEAAKRLGGRAILLTKFPEQIPADLPPTIRRFGYVPFSKVLPRAAAFVHHGGIGTTAQALAAGIPQLIMPLSHDQPDNAARAARLGVARILNPSHYKAGAVATLLEELLKKPKYGGQAKQVKARFSASDFAAKTCRYLEEI